MPTQIKCMAWAGKQRIEHVKEKYYKNLAEN